jgi:hypothetical protein
MAIYSSIGFDLDDKRYFHLASELTASQTNDRSRVLTNIAVALHKRCELLHNPLDTCHLRHPLREPTDNLVRELVLADPAPFVPLTMKKRGKKIDNEAKTVLLAGGATSSGATARRRRRMRPTVLR